MHGEAPRTGENRLLLWCLRGRRRNALAAAGLAALIGTVDWRVGLDVSLGAFYILPMILAATVLKRPQVVVAAAVFAVLRVSFNPAHSALETGLGFVMASLAYTGAGLFVAELVRNRQLVLQHVEQIRRHQALRQEAEEQLRVLVESSPAAIMTIDGAGRVLAANRAAHDLLACGAGPGLLGEPIGQYLPVLAEALKLDVGTHGFRTAAQCRGKRRNGEPFIAHTWFSTYAAPDGQRLAAIAVDTSEEMREREEQNLRQLLRSNRIVAGAVSHDIRNLCGAIAVVYSNLKRMDGLPDSEDFRALGALVEGLGKVASTELRSRAREELGSVDLSAVLEQLRIIIEPAWEEIGGQLHWQVPERPVPVVGEAAGLLQALLNLAHNSHRAVQEAAAQRLEVTVAEGPDKAVVRFRDSGPGVAGPELLFQPFQPGAEASGLGLYVSRAILRSFGGELRHEPQPEGCCFAVELEATARAEGVKR